MKLIFFLCLLFSFLSPLSAALYKSNMLNQKGEACAFLFDDEYVLEEKDNTLTLFHNGEEIRKKTILGDGYLVEEREYKERVFINDWDLIERKIVEKNGRVEEYNYFYNDSLLSQVNYYDGNEVLKIEYITLRDGRLLGYIVKDEGVYISDEYYVRVNSDEEIDVIEIKDNSSSILVPGGYTQEKDGVIYTYNSYGRLIEEKSLEKNVYYTYDEGGALIEKKTVATQITIDTYSSGSLLYSTIYTLDNNIEKRRTKLESGDIEEIRYINNEARYRFIYYSDGIRIKEASSI